MRGWTVSADATLNPGASPCGHTPFCSCPTPDPTPRLDALAADWAELTGAGL